MKNSIIKIFSFIGILLLLQGCHKEELSELSSIDFGKSKYFRSFLWLKVNPDTLTKTFQVEFNQAALKNSNSYIDLELIIKEGDKQIRELKNIELYLNGKKQKSNQFKIRVKDIKDDGKISLSMVFLPDAEGKHYSGYLSIVSSNKIDRVNESVIDSESKTIAIFRWDASYSVIINPLLLGLLIGIAILFCLLLIWFFLLKKKIYPVFTGGQILVFNNDVQEEKINLKGKIACYLGKSNIPEQSKIRRMFCGSYAYGLNYSDFRITVKPIPYVLHHDKHYKSKRLACIMEFKSINSLLKIYPENMGIFGKEVLYNDTKYKLDEIASIQYLNSRHQKFMNV